LLEFGPEVRHEQALLPLPLGCEKVWAAAFSR
jgi:hypothetical protein